MTEDIKGLAMQLRAWSEPISSGFEVPAVCVWTKYGKGVFATTACQKIYVMEIRGQTEDCPMCWNKIKFSEVK